MSYFVYFIESTNGSTYIGATVNLDKRIRQHNKEIKGGASATSIKVNQRIWIIFCYIEIFRMECEALKFEWRWKHISRQIQKKIKTKSKERRMEALNILINLEKSTTKAIPYSQWPNPSNVVHINKNYIYIICKMTSARFELRCSTTDFKSALLTARARCHYYITIIYFYIYFLLKYIYI